jgi:hypothetical protein
MWVMYDSTELDQIPHSALAVAGYAGGAWPTYHELAGRWPHSHLLSIAISASEDAECLDIENGDATPDQAPDWYHRQIARGVVKPVFYTSQSRVQEVIDVLARAGISRDRYRIWDAHYTYIPHITPGSDATQWTDRSMGRNLDESLCSDEFFHPTITVTPFVPADEFRWETEWRHLKGHRSWAAHRRRVALKRAMTKRRQEIYRLASHQRDGWQILNRYHRYMILKAYTK